MVDGKEYGIGEEHSPIECFSCGNCCIGYHPRVSHEEVAFTAKYLSISPDDFITRYVEVTRVGYLLRQTADGCVFLGWEKETRRSYCEIYPARPEACRNWVPGLSRRECLDGLAKLKGGNGGLLLATDVYENREQLENFYSILR